MNRKTIRLLLVIVFLLPCIAGAVTEEDFEAETTQHMINLCTVSVDDPLYHQAVNFCHGYVLGAYHYYEAIASGPQGIQLVCFTDAPPSRNDAVAMFVEWAKARPQYLGERPTDTQFRFLMEKWPCTR